MTSYRKSSLAVALLFCGIAATFACDGAMWGPNCTNVCGFCKDSFARDVECNDDSGLCPINDDGTFSCKFGWRGEKCDHPDCSEYNDCNTGECIAPGTCFCGEDINLVTPNCEDIRLRGLIGSAIAVGVISIMILFCDFGSRWYKRNHKSKSE